MWLLVDARSAAAALSISERTFHSLRKRSDFPQGATVVLGPRCVRFRLDTLHAFVRSLAAVPLGEPKQLQASRKGRSGKRGSVNAEGVLQSSDAKGAADTTAQPGE